MIEEKLEIVIITYNRYKYLENTLAQVLKSPFADCKITIIDNCSSDKTPEICFKYQELFSYMTIVRNEKNIGGNPNILRAVETSRSLYTWVLCDDDDYDFSDCEDFIQAIDSEKFDLIINFSSEFTDKQGRDIYDLLKNREIDENNLEIGSKFNKIEKSMIIGAKDLFEILGTYYYLILTFVPGSVFKTELFDSDCLIRGYDNVHNLYPHFPFITKSLENNFLIYKTRNEIIYRGKEIPTTFSLLYWLVGWNDSCLIIKDKKAREIVASNYFNNHSFIQMMVYSILLAKVNQEENFGNLVVSLISVVIQARGILKGVFLSILIILASMVPRFIYKLINDKIVVKSMMPQ